MNFFFQVLIVIVLSLVLQVFMPWWTAAIAGFVVGLAFNNPSFKSFSIGFIGVFVVWATYAFWLDVQNASVLSKKIAVLFSVHQPVLLLLITGIIGGITGGLGSWAGNETKKLVNVQGL